MTERKLLIVNSTMNSESELLSHQFYLANSILRKYPNARVLTTEVGGLTSDIDQHITKIAWRKTGLLRQAFNALTFMIALRGEIRKYGHEYVFFHMTPIQAALGTVYLRAMGIKTALWYAHKAKPISLRIAAYLTNVVFTAGPSSISIANKNIIFTGHHIDEKFFRSTTKENRYNFALIVGRLDRSKRVDVVIESLITYLKPNGPLDQILFVGSPSSAQDHEFVEGITRKYFEEVKQKKIVFQGKKNRIEIKSLLEECHVFVSASIGSLDKSVLEAAMAEVPVVCSIPDFLTDFGSWSKPKIAPSLREEIDAFFNSSHDIRKQRAKMVQAIALEKHSLTNWLSTFDEKFMK
jgi:glycosyltransferase involved in cell wall biosynthesis